MPATPRPAARFVALTLGIALALSACSAVPDSFACAHCACAPTARAASRPLLCSTVGREATCCMPVFLGS